MGGHPKRITRSAKIDHCALNHEYFSIEKKTKSGSTYRMTSGSVFRPICQIRVGVFCEQMTFL